jgi:AhpD family alkylhydroperoxidase
MASRLNLGSWPEGSQAMAALSKAVHNSGLDRSLIELVQVRVSQINGCAYCLDMHTKDARTRGETEQRLHLLPAWRETPLYSDRERAALALAEAITLIAGSAVSDDLFEEARWHFGEEELIQLVFAISTINTWNRLMIASKPPVGDYQSRVAVHA